MTKLKIFISAITENYMYNEVNNSDVLQRLRIR